MKRAWPWAVGGGILTAVGVVWTLQGLDVLRGSVMSGSSLWATIGPIVIVVGVALLVVAITIFVRRRREKP